LGNQAAAGLPPRFNALAHASDGPDAARPEIGIFFPPAEIHAYEPTIRPRLRAADEG